MFIPVKFNRFYNKILTVFIFIVIGSFLQPPNSLGYIGPGAGFAVATSLVLTITTLLITLLGIFLWPIKKIVKKIKRRKWKKISNYHLTKKKVIVLGYDGMDYTLLNEFIKKKKLPTFTAMAKTGTFTPLISTNPPESPVAWASFLTGCNPGKHNIFDFLSRDPATYLPKLSLAEVHPPRWTIPILKYRIPLLPGPVEGKRKGTPFWEILGERGINVAVIRVPVTFPAEKFDGVLLSSMGVPDMLGSQGTFSFYTTDELKLGRNEGGVIVKVEKKKNKIQTYLRGPRNSIIKSQPECRLPITIEINDFDETAILHLPKQKESIKLRLHEYSPWVEVSFSFGLGIKAHGLCKFYLSSISPEFGLYVTPINIHTEKPTLPISYPSFYSKYLSLSVGRFSTLGLAEDTWALNNGTIDEEAFLKQCYGYLEEREKVFYHELNRLSRGCLVHVFDTTDRIQHMFWQFADPDHPKFNLKKAEKYKDIILKIYERMDKITAEVLNKTDKDTSLYILSDHGFKTFRYGMNINTWLKEEGFLVLKEGIEEGEKFFRDVDWDKTKAYALGLSGIYLNIVGREKHGIVSAGNEAETLIKEISLKLMEYKDPNNETCPLHSVNNKHKIYKGKFVDNAPDIVLGFKPGYRVSWKTTLGGTPAEKIIEDNVFNWSGDHCIAPEFVPGIFLTNRKLNGTGDGEVSIMDIAPTILSDFGIDPSNQMDGKVLQ